METSNSKNQVQWDFFIAHAHKDKAVALELHGYIVKNNFTAFLDQIAIKAGTYWDQEIPLAQQNSLITIALISGNIREAHYARDEIQTAINFARSEPKFHKIIPVYLDDSLEESADIVYGLRLIQGINISTVGSIEILANVLCENLNQFKSNAKTISGEQKLHILLSYPTGPLVKPEDIPRVLIEMYATLIKESEAKLVVAEVNAFRQEANPETKFIIPLHKIPSPEKIPSFNFWLDVFDYARLQGPRMLAALLLAVPDEQFDARAKNARFKLLNRLKEYS